MINIPVIARRELNTYFLSLIAYFVLTAFAVAHGLSFVAFLSASSIEPNAVAADAFQWALTLLIFATPLIAMRLLSEEAGGGTLETLLTTPVSEGEIVLGKYVAALIFCMAMLAPVAGQCVFLALVGRLDWGPVASGFLGLYLVAGLFLAIGVLCSSLTRVQIGSAIMALVAVIGLWVLDAVLWRSTSGIAQVLRYLTPRAHFEGFLKGIIDSRDLVYFVTTILLFLFLSVTVLKMRKWRSVGVPVGMMVVLSVALAALVCYISTRRYARVDMTGKLRYTLHSKTRRMLRSLDRPLKVTLLNLGELDATIRWAYERSEDMVEELKALSPRVSAEELRADVPEHLPGIEMLAARMDIEGSSVILQSGDSHEVISLIKTVEAPQWSGAGPRFRGEAAFAAALVRVTDVTKRTVYFLTGHGERPIEGRAPAPGADQGPSLRYQEAYSLSRLVKSLKADNFESRTLNLAQTGKVPEDCTVLIVADPLVPLPQEELSALRDYLQERGGNAIIMLDSRAVSEKTTNLDAILSDYGIKAHLDALGMLLEAQRVGQIEDRPLVSIAPKALVRVTQAGYAAHPITSDLQNYDLSLSMCAPLEIADPTAAPGLSVRPLLTATDESWGERSLRDMSGTPRYDEGEDVPPPLTAAVIVEARTTPGAPPLGVGEEPGGPRLLVLGSSQSFVNRNVAQRPANLYLLLNAVNWMAGKVQMLGIPAKDADIHIVYLTSSQRRTAFWVFLVGLPVCVTVLGAAVWLVRRR